jgi:hypothetical protein
MSTTIWYRGKAWAFDDEDEAATQLKEIDMAKAQKRTPKGPAPAAARKEAPAEAREFSLAIPATCEQCDIATGENNTGGFYVTHKSRGGNPISGSFRPHENPAAWLERVHREEL